MRSVACFVLLAAAVVAAARFPGSTRTTPEAASAPDDPGRRIFEQRCAVCHTTGARAAQGPGLGGVVGRNAASMPFGYSRALRDSHLTWDRATLDRFLRDPPQLVPGTMMPMPRQRGRQRNGLAGLSAVIGDRASRRSRARG
jgi:cytochrome c